MKIVIKYIYFLVFLSLLLFVYYNWLIKNSSIFLVKSFNPVNALVDFDEFDYVIPNFSCSSYQNQSANIILIITSYAGNLNARNAIRRAYPVLELKKLHVIRIFLLGLLKTSRPSSIVQTDIINENKNHGDILQGNFIEAYRNLTYKHLMGLRWASLCEGASYIIKMDDDIVVDLYRALDLINEKKDKGITLMGYLLEGQEVKRLKNNKWYVTKNEYSKKLYPSFLSGWFYVTTPLIASSLSNASRTVPYFWIDDVYITGILANILNITHQSINQYISPFTEYLDCCIRERINCNFVAGPSNGYYAMHNTFKRLIEKCLIGLCQALPSGNHLKDVCIVNWQIPIDVGHPIVKPIKL